MKTIFFLISSLFLISCNNKLKKNSEEAMFGTNWVLEKMEAATGEVMEALIGQEVTLEVKNDGIIGHGGCNSYRGKLSLDGNTMQLENIVATKKYCQDYSNQENQYFDYLRSVRSYAMEGKKLTFTCGKGKLFFKPQTSE